MKPIGDHPIRQLEAFGIASLLGEEARVFYNTIFNTRNLGRTVDLLAARLAKSGVDELRLRQVLVLGVFEAYRLQIGEVMERKRLAQEKAKAQAAAQGKEYVAKEEEEKLDQPITIECGVDNEKIGVSLSMPISAQNAVDPVLLVERINSREAVTEFEKLGLQIFDAADLLVIRYQAETKRLEFSALISLKQEVVRQPVELVSVSVEDAKRAPKPLEYTEAGDLDYESLLEDDTRVGGKKGKGFTNALVKKAKEGAEGNSRITAGSDEDEDDSLSIGNEDAQADGQSRIKGKKGKGAGAGEVDVEGDADPDGEASARFSGKTGGAQEDQTVFDSDSDVVSVKKKKVNGRKSITESEEAEIEADEIEEGGTAIKFKGSKGQAEDQEQDLTIAGGGSTAKKKSKLKVHQSKSNSAEDESEEEEEFVIEGETQKKEKQSKITFKAGQIEEQEGEEEEIAYGRGGKRLRGSPASVEDEVIEEEVQAAAPIKRMRKLIRRIWPFGKKKDEDTAEESDLAAGEGADGPQVIEAEENSEQSDEMLVRFKGEKGTGAKEHEYRFKASAAGKGDQKEEKEQEYRTRDGESGAGSSETKGESENESDQILKTFEEKVIDKTVDRIQREAVKLKDEIKDERTKRWVDNLSRDLIAEKANLRETAKRISENVRKKEHEFKTKSMALEEQLRKRDEEVAQKTNALTRTREQLTQVTRSIERMKQLTQEAADAASFKQKYALSQKVLQTTKDENTLLQAKVEEMKNQITNLQLGGKNKGPSQTEYNVLQTKYDRSFKQMEDLKRQNQKLLAEIGNRRGMGAGADSAELKKKVEAAQRMQMISKKENEILQERVAKMQRDDRNLRTEIARLQEALRNSTVRRGGGGGGKAA